MARKNEVAEFFLSRKTDNKYRQTCQHTSITCKVQIRVKQKLTPSALQQVHCKPQVFAYLPR